MSSYSIFLIVQFGRSGSISMSSNLSFLSSFASSSQAPSLLQRVKLALLLKTNGKEKKGNVSIKSIWRDMVQCPIPAQLLFSCDKFYSIFNATIREWNHSPSPARPSAAPTLPLRRLALRHGVTFANIADYSELPGRPRGRWQRMHRLFRSYVNSPACMLQIQLAFEVHAHETYVRRAETNLPDSSL